MNRMDMEEHEYLTMREKEHLASRMKNLILNVLRTFYIALNIVGIFAISYCIGSFTSMTWNPSQWSEEVRAGVSAIGVGVSCLAYLANLNS